MITRVETNLGGGLQPRHGWVFSARAADQKRRGTLCASYIARGSTLGLSPRVRSMGNVSCSGSSRPHYLAGRITLIMD